MAVTAAMVKELREMTGAGMMDCKKALTATEGDMDAAVEFLRKNGQAKAEKKAGRIAAEGICRIAVKDEGTAAVVEVNSETDFVAKNEKFQNFVAAVAEQAVNSDNTELEAFLDEAWHEAADRYADFLKQNRNKKVVLLELGVGFNTPIIIRFPFEKMVRENSSYSLIRLNMDEAVVPESFGKRAIGIEGDMERAITDIRGQVL